MNTSRTNRTRIVGLRLTTKEYEQLRKKWKATTCRKLSDYIRRTIFDKQVVTTYRNQSLDDFMSEAIQLKNEINSISNNFNQAVRRLHSCHQMSDVRDWIMTYEQDRKILLSKVEDTKLFMQRIAEKWLR